jgi:Class II flagellar assembly regulator
MQMPAARALPVLNRAQAFLMGTTKGESGSMKIAGTGPVRAQEVRRRDRAKSPDGAGFTAELAAEAPVQGGHAGLGIERLDGPLALQEVPSGGERDRRARADGEAILDRLESLRNGLLAGHFPRYRLRELLTLVGARREAAADPGLRQVLEEIELRAAVEVAKLEAIAS